MGKKSAKGKERKQRWKEEQARVQECFMKVKAATEMADPLTELLPVFKQYKRNGLDISIEFLKRKDVTDDVMEWAFQLLSRNMKSLYERSEGGWKEKVKREEMGEDAADYLVCRDNSTDGAPVAFVHFRFDLDDDDEVLYCYEIMLNDGVRGKGLGRFLMQTLELLAFKTGMQRVVLTVFKHNTQAYDFFTKLKYVNDDTCPSWDGGMVDDKEVSYEILSKCTDPKKKQEAKPLATQANGASS